MSKRSYRNKVVHDALCNIVHMDEEQLLEAEEHLLCMEWDDNLGAKPKNFDELPMMNVCIWHSIRRRPTKYNQYVRVLLEAIDLFLTERGEKNAGT